MKVIIIYHRNCRDGQFAAWAAISSIKQHAETLSFQPGEELDYKLLDGNEVVILDCAPTLDQYQELMKICPLVTVLDHHKSNLFLDGKIGCHIDVTKSGAMLAWERFHPSEPAPWFIRYVQDRDLWRWELPHSREVNAYFATLPDSPWSLDFYLDQSQAQVIEKGKLIYEHQRQQVDQIAKHAQEIEFAGYTVQSVSCGVRDLRSMLGEKLCKNRPFAVIWSPQVETGEALVSLRSQVGCGLDVSLIAEQFGGGGHKHSAGCKVPITEICQLPGHISTISSLIEQLKSGNDEQIVTAASTLAAMGGSARKAIDTLIYLLSDESDTVRKASSHALMAIYKTN